MKKQTIRSIAAIFACAIVGTSMVTTAFADETTTVPVETTTVTDETTTTVEETTTALDVTTAPEETTEVETTTTIVTDAPITQGQMVLGEDGKSMYNDFVKLVADRNGKYTLGTTNGDPLSSTDNDKRLIFGFPNSSSTSYVTIVVDDAAREYVASNGEFDLENKRHLSSTTIGNVFVGQSLSLVPNNSTGREDVLEIRLEIQNNDSVAHNIGGRIMIDTMLGSNDSAPFRVPGTGAVTTETEYVGADIPEYWQAFDSLTSPTIISQGSFLRNNNNPPDKVQFVNWTSISGTKWDYQITPGRSNGDSAVAATWNQRTIQPGETIVFKTYYGLSELTQDLLPPLALSVYGDSTVNLSIPEELANVLFTAYVENIGEGDAENAYVRIELPNGFSLVDGSNERIELETISVAELKQSNWTIQIPTDFTLGTYPITIYVGADGIDEKSVTRYITLVDEREDDRDVFPPVVTTTTTAYVAPKPSSPAASSPKTGDAGVCGVAAALAASVAACFAMKRKKDQ